MSAGTCDGGVTVIIGRQNSHYQAQAARLLGKSSEWIPDSELIAACLSGQAFAWDALIERYQSLIYTVALRMGLKEADAADVFQDVCLLLLNHLTTLRDPTRLAAWLAAMTRREVLRAQKRRGPALQSEVAETEGEYEAITAESAHRVATPEDTLLALEDRQLVTAALQRLPVNCQQLLIPLYCEDPPRSYAEVACRLHLPMGSIGPQRARCLRRLQKFLAEMGF